MCANNDNDLGNLNSVVADLPSDFQGILGLTSGITCADLDDAVSSTNSGINDYLLTEGQCSDLRGNDNVINLCCPDDLPDTGSQGGDCFSGRSTVHVQGKGETRIDQLQIGDAIQQLDGSYSTVYSFAHRAPKQIVDYLQIYTTSTKKPLEISDEHMVHANGWLVPAGHVKVGDSLMVRANNETTTAIVTKIGSVSLKGAYAPYTKSGNIVVNGVAASSYVVVEEFNYFLTPSQQHKFQQIINGPHRMLYNWGLLGEETYDNVFGYSQSMMLQRRLKIFLFQYYFGHLMAALVGYLVWKKQKQQAKQVADLVDLKNSLVLT